MKIFFSRQKPIQTTVNRRVGLHAHLVLVPVKPPLQISCLLSWSTETTYVRTSDLTLPLNGLLAPFYLFMHKMFEIEKEAEERDFGLHWELEWVESAELENVQIDLDGERTCSPFLVAISSSTFSVLFSVRWRWWKLYLILWIMVIFGRLVTQVSLSVVCCSPPTFAASYVYVFLCPPVLHRNGLQ